jgi:hypothetical protein
MSTEVTVTGIIAGAILVAILSTQSFYKHEAETIAKMVKDGAYPLAASCSLKDDYNQDPVCVALASQQGINNVLSIRN